MKPSPATLSVRGRIEHHRPELEAVLARYGASEPRLFGSVARGDALDDSDLDIMVSITDPQANHWLQVAGIMDEFATILGMKVDVVTIPLLKGRVSTAALRDVVPL